MPLTKRAGIAEPLEYGLACQHRADGLKEPLGENAARLAYHAQILNSVHDIR
jgi:hypothetical protein